MVGGQRLKSGVIRYWAEVLILAAVYFMAGKLGLSLAFLNASATAVWPPTGISLAVLLLFGLRLWPGVFVGAFLVNLATQGSVWTVLGIAAGNTLEAVIGAWLVSRFAGGAKAFESTKTLSRFTFLAAFVSPAVSSTVGVTSLCFGSFATWAQYGPIWVTWWLGDCVSALVIAPLIVSWVTVPFRRLTRREIVESGAVLLAVAAIGRIVFLTWFPTLGGLRNPFSYLVLLPLVWAAYRFGQQAAITTAFLSCILAIWGTLHHLGPFVTPDNNLSLLLLQAFIGTATLAALILSAVLQERERAEEVHARLSSIVECSDDAIIGESLKGVIEDWNEGAERIFGYRSEEIVGQPLTRLIPADLQHEETELLQRLRRGERVDHYETVRLARDGRQIDVSLTVSPVKDPAGSIIGVSKIARNITERKRGERALRQSEQFNRTIIESSRDCITTLSLEGLLLWMSETGRTSLCIPELSPFLGKSWTEFWQGEDCTAARAAVEAAARGETGTFVGYFPVAGQPRWWDVRITPILNGAGKPETLLAVSRDVTEREIAEDQLATAQASLKAYAQQLEETVAARTAKLKETIEELEAFSYSLSHDMRAPLRAIQGYSQIVLDEIGERTGEPVAGYLRRTMSAAKRLDQLLQDVLAITRLSREEICLEPVDVETLLEQIIFERPDLQRPRAEIIVEKPLLCLLAHEASLTQCLTNLINNAVKFVAPGVTPRVRIFSEPVDEEVRLWIEDNGIGIEKEEQGKLFEMFHRIHAEKEYEGTGIGLAIVRKAAERMQGSVGMESEPGKGSRFWIQLKRADQR